MRSIFAVLRKLVSTGALSGALLFANIAVAEGDLEFDLEVYGWLPTLDIQAEDGSNFEISREDIVNNLDIAGMAFATLRKDKWVLATDLIYFHIEDDDGTPIGALLELEELGIEAAIVTPTIGYTVAESDKYFVDLYTGARYIWIQVDQELRFDPILPGPSTKQKGSESASNWDGIVGLRGHYQLADKWYMPFALNGGTGQSDSVFEVNAGFAYRFDKLDAAFGWRYINWDFGKDASPLKELTVNGPYVGAIFRW